MWLSRTKSTVRIHNTSPNFHCSSFKDIQRLCSDDSNTHQLTRKPSIFHRVRLANSILRAFSPNPQNAPAAAPPPSNELAESEPPISLPAGSEKRIVVYFTSLRVVRSTFEDCKAVRSILRSFRVSIDERDLSMDSAFLEEIKTILNLNQPNRPLKLGLPRVFIGGRYIGGADEIRQLHESGELKKFVEGLPPADSGVCECCGGYRFILCDECSGSHKCYYEKGGFRTCTACNENGLIRCPSCSSAPI